MLSENTDKRSFEHRFDDNGMSLCLSDHSEVLNTDVHFNVPSGVIQFYFALDGPLHFQFSPQYSKELSVGQYYFMYNPQKDLSFSLKTYTKSRWVVMFITIEKLHSLFLNSDSELPFLNGENAQKVLYDENEIGSQVKWALESLFTSGLNSQSLKIFSQAKNLEVIALHFDQKSEDVEACPFLRDEGIRSKIKKAKQELTDRMTDPPSIAELALGIGISEYKLKSGFKEMYGNTLGGYLLDYKMNSAKVKLDQRGMQVNEVAYALGYGSPSHFITAFKKKYGITPKKYLQQS